MTTLLTKVKANVILEHDTDDELLQRLIDAAVAYAESYQHLTAGTYEAAVMPPTTEAAVIMLASHFYESRDGSTGGFFSDNVQAGQQVWKGNYCAAKRMLVRLLLTAGFLVSERRYIGLEEDTGYHYFAIDVAKEYLEE